MTETAVFVCNICNEPSSDICIACTKDACRNHLCERCRRCSDCCDCDIPLTESLPETARVSVHSALLDTEPAAPAPVAPAEAVVSEPELPEHIQPEAAPENPPIQVQVGYLESEQVVEESARLEENQFVEEEAEAGNPPEGPASNNKDEPGQ